MAGAPTQLKKGRSSGRAHVLTVLAFAALHSAAGPALAADFLIVENPHRLVVYNKYQQAATARDRALLVRFAPMRILNSGAVLGDGFTACMEVEIGGEVFFLLKDARSDLARTGALGWERICTDATLLLDTVQILTRQTIRITPPTSPARYLAPGDRVVRMFRQGNTSYCRTAGTPPAYGWIDIVPAREGRDWMAVKEKSPPTRGIPRHIVERIRSRLGETNRLLVRLFGYFNDRTGQQRKTPQWKMEASPEAVSCVLQDAPRSEDFRESTLYLLKDLENIVLGTGLLVTREGSFIEVRRR